MTLANLALNLVETTEGRFAWQILSRASRERSFSEIVQRGAMEFTDSASAMRAGYKAMLRCEHLAAQPSTSSRHAYE